MMEIFDSICKSKGFVYSDSVKDIILEDMNKLRKKPNPANARDVRNYFNLKYEKFSETLMQKVLENPQYEFTAEELSEFPDSVFMEYSQDNI